MIGARGPAADMLNFPGSQILPSSKQSIRGQTSNNSKRSAMPGSRISNSTQRSNIQAVYGVPNTAGAIIATRPSEKTPLSSQNQKSTDGRVGRKQLVREQMH